jgi:hypothetical protein
LLLTSSSNRKNFAAIAATNTEAIGILLRRNRVRAWAMSKVRVTRRYMFKSDDGRTERACSMYDRNRTNNAAINPIIAHGTDARVWMGLFTFHKTTSISCKATRTTAVAYCDLLAVYFAGKAYAVELNTNLLV